MKCRKIIRIECATRLWVILKSQTAEDITIHSLNYNQHEQSMQLKCGLLASALESERPFQRMECPISLRISTVVTRPKCEISWINRTSLPSSDISQMRYKTQWNGEIRYQDWYRAYDSGKYLDNLGHARRSPDVVVIYGLDKAKPLMPNRKKISSSSIYLRPYGSVREPPIHGLWDGHFNRSQTDKSPRSSTSIMNDGMKKPEPFAPPRRISRQAHLPHELWKLWEEIAAKRAVGSNLAACAAKKRAKRKLFRHKSRVGSKEWFQLTEV